MRYRTRPRTCYQAARFERREELIANEKLLADHNITSLSKWLYEAATTTGQETQCESDEERAFFAQLDYEGVLNVDFLLYYSEDLAYGSEVKSFGPTERYVPALWARGGRHVEFGIALAQAMNIVVIGPKENIFHWFDRMIAGERQVMHFDTLEEFITWYDAKNVLPDDAEMPNNEAPPE